MSTATQPIICHRPLRAEDANTAAHICQSALRNGWDAHDWRESIRDRRYWCVLSLLDDEPAGVFAVRRCKSGYEVCCLAVARGCRRHGVGRAMLELIAKAGLPHKTRMLVSEESTGTHLWLRACGWRAVGVVRGVWGVGGPDAYRFVIGR